MMRSVFIGMPILNTPKAHRELRDGSLVYCLCGLIPEDAWRFHRTGYCRSLFTCAGGHRTVLVNVVAGLVLRRTSAHASRCYEYKVER